MSLSLKQLYLQRFTVILMLRLFFRILTICICLCVFTGAGFADGFVKANGSKLVVDGKPVFLRGVCFSNQFWVNEAISEFHHGEQDYKRLADLGVNLVRFYINYTILEDEFNPGVYKDSGWEWLDKNIEWARKNGIYLILDMHVPPGGYQSLGEGMGLWNNLEAQDRLKKLWQAIAKRYKDETAVGAYELVNEPIVSHSQKQWEHLAQELVDAIRKVDKNHLIVVERVNGTKGEWRTYNNPNLFLLDDDNIMYTFHFYYPFFYTHQFASWTDQKEGGAYPDTDRLAGPATLEWADATFDSPTLPAGDSDWKVYSSKPYTVKSPLLVCAKPVFQVSRNAGTAYCGGMWVEELDENGRVKKRIRAVDMEKPDGWSFWAADDNGSWRLEEGAGRKGSPALVIEQTSNDANCHNNLLRFVVSPGKRYRVSGWMKGEGVSAGAECRVRIDFEKSPSGQDALVFDKKYLAYELDRFVEFGKEHNVPMFVGEFGLHKTCFENGRNGVGWTEDMLDLMNERGLNYAWHAYHEGELGLFVDDIEKLPCDETANQDLLDVFARKLKPEGNKETTAGNTKTAAV